MKRKVNPMKLAMEVCRVRQLSADAGKLSSIIHSIKENGIEEVGLTKDNNELAIEFVVFQDGTVLAGQDTFNDILTEEGSIEIQDTFDSVEEMKERYTA